MYLTARNVNTAFQALVSGFQSGEIPTTRSTSRYGDVMYVPQPVTVAYERPLERVLFNPARDCNPFFHLYEALWMLAGWNNVSPLAYYNSKMSEFSDDGLTFNGAYGYRWRHSLTLPEGTVRGWSNDWQRDVHYHHENSKEVDQLQVLIDHLKQKRDSRRAVLQMWNVEDDLLKIDTSKDVCCNVCAFFSIRRQQVTHLRGDEEAAPFKNYLDMTVVNRSNDLVWGMLGADYVSFSLLQEYAAARLGVDVGTYHHVTNNLHSYFKTWEPDKWLGEHLNVDHYINDVRNRVPLISDPATFDKELSNFVGAFNGEEEPWSCVPHYREPFLQHVAGPALTAFRWHKLREYELARHWSEEIKADDWRIACASWIERRRRAWEERDVAGVG